MLLEIGTLDGFDHHYEAEKGFANGPGGTPDASGFATLNSETL